MISHPFKLRIWDVERSIYLEDTVMWSVAGMPPDMMPGQPPFVPFLMVALLSPATKYVVEQYTGLKDRDGREIYEGDIVSFSQDQYDRGPVIWSRYGDHEYVEALETWLIDCGFITPLSPAINGGRYTGQHTRCEGGGVTILGNIHEHPTLLAQHG